MFRTYEREQLLQDRIGARREDVVPRRSRRLALPASAGGSTGRMRIVAGGVWSALRKRAWTRSTLASFPASYAAMSGSAISAA